MTNINFPEVSCDQSHHLVSFKFSSFKKETNIFYSVWIAEEMFIIIKNNNKNKFDISIISNQIIV